MIVDRLVQHDEDALRGGHRGLHDVVLLGQVADRLKNARSVYWKKATSAPRVTTPASTAPVPYHSRRAAKAHATG